MRENDLIIIEDFFENKEEKLNVRKIPGQRKKKDTVGA